MQGHMIGFKFLLRPVVLWAGYENLSWLMFMYAVKLKTGANWQKWKLIQPIQRSIACLNYGLPENMFLEILKLSHSSVNLAMYSIFLFSTCMVARTLQSQNKMFKFLISAWRHPTSLPIKSIGSRWLSYSPDGENSAFIVERYVS